jgi:hypothetical protein
MVRAVAVLLFLVVPIAAGAAPTPGPGGPDRAARDGGMIDGRVTGVDYQKSTLAVDCGSRGRMAVSVMPSTSIQAKETGYHSILDLKRGEHVQIFSSVVGDTYVAQIIRILP